MRLPNLGLRPVVITEDDEVVVNLIDDKLTVKCSPFDADTMRRIPGARYHRNTDTWVCPATRSQIVGLKSEFDHRLVVSNKARAYSEELFATNKRPVETHPDLFPFQKDGVEFLVSAGSAILGDDMGLGKSFSAIEWMRNLGHGPHLVVCPNSMKYKWASEINRWWPGADTVVIDGTAGQRRKQIEGAPANAVFIINYESLRTHSKLAPWGGKALTAKQKEPKELNKLPFACVVVDEAHKIKDPAAQQTMAVKQMGLQAHNRLAMTGTLLVNSPDDVWSVGNFVAPEEWGSRTWFRENYCEMRKNFASGREENVGLRHDKIEEFDAWFQPRWLRRTKPEVLKELPDKFDIDYRLLPLTTQQAKSYKALAKDSMTMVDEELLITTNPLTLLTRLRQVACAELVVNEDGEVTGMTGSSNKLNAIEDILEEAPGEPLVIYAESRLFIEYLARQLDKDYRVGLITGGESPALREKTVIKFQDGKLDIILGTMGAGAEGITLTRANRIVLAQQSPSHARNAQTIDRVHRIGQDRGVQPIVLISRGTVDEAIAVLDRTKEGRLQQLVRDPKWMKEAIYGKAT